MKMVLLLMNSWQAQLYLSAKGAVTIASQLLPLPEDRIQDLFLGDNKEMVDSFKVASIGQLLQY